MSILSKVNAAAAIRAGLEALLKPVDAAWEQSIVDAHVQSAHGQMRSWTEYLGDPEPRSYEMRCTEGRYVLWTPPVGYQPDYRPVTHAMRQQRLAAGEYRADVERATQDGKTAYRQTRDAFLLRVTDKIAYIVQDKEVTIGGNIEFVRMICGLIQVDVGDGTTFFVLKVAVKTNYRYGHNAANGVITIYSQYPVTVSWAMIKKEKVLPASEEMLAHRISGLPLDHKERASRDQIDARKALNAEKHRVEDLKSAYYDIANDHDYIVDLELRMRPSAHEPLNAEQRERYQQLVIEYRAKIAKRCARVGITDPGSKAAARALQKECIAKLKQLRAKA